MLVHPFVDKGGGMDEEIIDWFGDFAQQVDKRRELQCKIFRKMSRIYFRNDFSYQQKEEGNDNRLENELKCFCLPKTDQRGRNMGS